MFFFWRTGGSRCSRWWYIHHFPFFFLWGSRMMAYPSFSVFFFFGERGGTVEGWHIHRFLFLWRMGVVEWWHIHRFPFFFENGVVEWWHISIVFHYRRFSTGWGMLVAMSTVRKLCGNLLMNSRMHSIFLISHLFRYASEMTYKNIYALRN